MWDWRCYITLAIRIQPTTFDSNDEIAAARAAISRAYYGAYHTTWSYVLHKQYLERDKDHKVVWLELMKHKYTADERKVGQYGSELMGYRKKADYDATFHDRLDRMSQSAVHKAKEICRLLGQQL